MSRSAIDFELGLDRSSDRSSERTWQAWRGGVEVRRAPAIVVGAGVAGLSAALTLADGPRWPGRPLAGSGRGAGRPIAG